GPVPCRLHPFHAAPPSLSSCNPRSVDATQPLGVLSPFPSSGGTKTMIATALQIAAAGGLGGGFGLVCGVFGGGGGFLVIPVLGILYDIHQQTAQGTALVMVVPNVLFAFWRYRQRFGVDLRMAVTIAASAMVTTYPTARLATGLDPHGLRLAFVAFLAGLAAVVAYRT